VVFLVRILVGDVPPGGFVAAATCGDRLTSTALGVPGWQETLMALSGVECPDCCRVIRDEFEQTVTGRRVCPDCAQALRVGTTVGVATSNAGVGFGVWAMLTHRLRRRPRRPSRS
jgi:hypothetical protein